MPDYDASFKIVARTSGRELAQLAGIACRRWQRIGGEVQATERLADRAFLAQGDRERFVVYMEAYTRWDASVPWSVLAKAGLLSERERLPTQSVAYVLLPKGYQPQEGTFRLAVNDEPTQQGLVPGSLSVAAAARTLVGSSPRIDGALSAVLSRAVPGGSGSSCRPVDRQPRRGCRGPRNLADHAGDLW